MITVHSYNRDKNSIAGSNIMFSGAQKLSPDSQYSKRKIMLIALDIDGTISDRMTNKVSPEIKAAIKKVVNKGIKVVLNTGRDYEEAAKIAEELNLNTPIICNYGKYIKQSGKLLYENPSKHVDLKGETLEYIAKQWGIKQENIMSIGNDLEDISMFKKSGIAVALEGSSYFDEIKPFAHYIADNCGKSGVALALKKLVL